MKKTAILLGSLAVLSACNQTKKEETPESTHSLVVVYSQTGATQQVADVIQQLTGADMESIKCVEPYSGDFGETIGRWQKEMQDSVMPALEPIAADIAKYDTIYLGYPIWGGTFASPMASFLKDNSLAGKVVIPFCTFGSGGLNTSVAQLSQVATGATILEGYGVRNARIQAALDSEVEEFLIRSGIIAGEVEALAEFSEEVPVDADAAEIFKVATTGYQFPLGEAVAMSKRERGEATEYCFDTNQNTKIYVLDHHMQKSAPEFTQVVR